MPEPVWREARTRRQLLFENRVAQLNVDLAVRGAGGQ
jgi:hypothetical protein